MTGPGIGIAIAGAIIGGCTIARPIFVIVAKHAARSVWRLARSGVSTTCAGIGAETFRTCVESDERTAQEFTATGGAIARFVEEAAMIARLLAATGEAIARFAEDAAMIDRLLAAIGGRIVFGSSAIGVRSGGTGVKCGKGRGTDTAAVTAVPDQVAVASFRWSAERVSRSIGDCGSVGTGESRVDKADPGIACD